MLQMGAITYELGSLSIFIKFDLRLPRPLWYTLEKKIQLITKILSIPMKVERCEFPGVNSPAYQYKSFCYLPVGSLRLIALRQVNGERLMFDFRFQRTHLETRGIIFFPTERKINYGLHSRRLVRDNINKLFKELDIRHRVDAVSGPVVLEVAKVVPPELLNIYTSKLIDELGEGNKIEGRYASYSIKIMNVSGTIMLKLISTPITPQRVTPAIEEAKKILQSAMQFP